MKLERDLPLEVFKPHVQIYAIVEAGSGDYDLLGHGFLSIITDEVEQETVHYLEVESTKDAELMLRSRLRLSNNFEKQRGSVIVWNDSSQKHYYDLALSFEGEKECDIFWRLICEKIGKNYLDISARDSLELPNEANLPYILDKTKTAKDMVEYYLLNCPSFITALASLFDKFQAKTDKMGMGMIGRIIRSILSNLDYRMVQALFKDPTFALLLNVQKFLTEIDFPQRWASTVRIRSLIPLGDDLGQKVLLIHRLNFYRENILDLTKQGYLEHILVMTQIEFSKEIVTHLTRSSTLEELLKLTYMPGILKKDIGEEETHSPEQEQIKKQEFAQKKLEFLLEALIMAKQMQCEKGEERFLERVIKSGVMDMATQYFDQGITKALDFFNCLAQLTPSKFIEHLKVGFREKPSESLHSKLAKKYCLGSESLQNKILELVQNIAETFKNKQNLDFFIGTFLATVFSCCPEPKAILNVVSDLQNLLDNAEPLFQQMLKSKVMDKLVPFLRNQRPDKTTELRAIKLLKRVLLDNADSSWIFKKVHLCQLNQQIIKSGYFDYCMTLLLKNIRMNNILSSSMLENIKILREVKRFTPFHKEIQQNYQDQEALAKYLEAIFKMKEEKEEQREGGYHYDLQQQAEQEREEAYLMAEADPNLTTSQELGAQANEDRAQQLESLRQLNEEIGRREEEEIQQMGQPAKKVKQESEVEISIQFDLPFEDEEGEK